MQADIPYEIISMHKQIHETAEHLRDENRDLTKRNVGEINTLTHIRYGSRIKDQTQQTISYLFIFTSFYAASSFQI